MKRLILSFCILFAGISSVLAQDASIASGSFDPAGTINVGQSSTLTIGAGAASGSYAAGELVITISVPEQFYSAANPPQGSSSYSWSKSGNTWTGTNTSTVSSLEAITLIVTGVAPTTQGAMGTSVNIFPQGVNDSPGNNSVTATLAVAQGAPLIINVTPPTNNVTTGTAVTLTASGCTGGTYSWSPAGGTVGGVGSNTYTVAAQNGTNTYTATCSVGQEQGSATITGTAAPQDNIVASASPSTITTGGSTTLSASGCVNGQYTWSHSLGSGASVTASPTANTTYTVQCTTPAGGVSTTTVSVTVNPVACAANAGTLN